MDTTFSVQLQKLRKEKGITQDVLASHLGVSPQAVSKWENGSYPDGDLLPQIADFFGVSIDHLYGRATDDISLEQRILDQLQSIEIKKKGSKYDHGEYFEQMMKILWSMQVASWRSQKVYYDRNVIDDEKNGYLASQLNMNCGTSFMSLNKSLEYYMLIKEPENGFARYFSDEQRLNDMTKLFRFFGDKDNLKITLFMMSLKWDESVRSQTIAIQLDIPVEKVEKALEFLADSVVKHTFFKAQIINEFNKSESIYHAAHTRTVMPLMVLVAVDGMLKTPQNYSMQTCSREGGGEWIHRNELAFIKNGKKE
ncbi:MAG: helix-turn-helix transcriptional regulator [Oscillospiraceae bacterium]|nr:helix-turn-helix transcriptional regulator [Oscillospiraceae bacterium]